MRRARMSRIANSIVWVSIECVEEFVQRVGAGSDGRVVRSSIFRICVAGYAGELRQCQVCTERANEM